MKQNVNFSTFADSFESIRPDSFSRAGLVALFDYLEQYEEECGSELELDVIAFCCEFTEYESLEEFNETYNTREIFETWDEVAENTTVIMVDAIRAITGEL